jgi:hypothetical protein
LSQSPIPVFIRYLWECQKRKKIGLKRREAKMGHYGVERVNDKCI